MSRGNSFPITGEVTNMNRGVRLISGKTADNSPVFSAFKLSIDAQICSPIDTGRKRKNEGVTRHALETEKRMTAMNPLLIRINSGSDQYTRAFLLSRADTAVRKAVHKASINQFKSAFRTCRLPERVQQQSHEAREPLSSPSVKIFPAAGYMPFVVLRKSPCLSSF